ncbi:PREDICTED: transcription initiation factor TFIID subunit 8-like isoform X2 [Tarenaya hassleriana]|uniref:transcription initiation factor TFIID subunit 8-like isoform X2 n=1 Tax=Tarenaya hassleriana TaxID=28532 RepID=UPI00053C27E4|nr:PREDICTED: transcription initiation factor TFIID subunit 8-like isoform X2 [Tarenaya hassleriana]
MINGVARMAVAQTCESVEVNSFQESQLREGVRFSSFQESALATLTDVAVRYVQRIGKTALLYSNMAGRTEGNASDIVQALEDLGSGLGFSGVSGIDYCFAYSGVVKEIIRYTGEAEEMPFAYSLPCFPINRGKRPAPSFPEVGARPPDEHIPVWLPAFPETKISVQSEAVNVRALDGDSDIAELDRQSKENGSAHLTEQQSSHGYKPEFHKSVNQKDVENSTQEADVNPFLVSPLRFGKKQGSLVIRPVELSNDAASINHGPEMHMVNKHLVVLEALAPADKIAQNMFESEDGEKKVPVRTRSVVHFKIGTRKASMGWAVKQILEEKVNQKVVAWFREEYDKKKEKKPESGGNWER